jgi:hypothetical protein
MHSADKTSHGHLVQGRKKTTRNNLEIQKSHKINTFFVSVPGKFWEQNVYIKSGISLQ